MCVPRDLDPFVMPSSFLANATFNINSSNGSSSPLYSNHTSSDNRNLSRPSSSGPRGSSSFLHSNHASSDDSNSSRPSSCGPCGNSGMDIASKLTILLLYFTARFIYIKGKKKFFSRILPKLQFKKEIRQCLFQNLKAVTTLLSSHLMYKPFKDKCVRSSQIGWSMERRAHEISKGSLIRVNMQVNQRVVARHFR